MDAALRLLDVVLRRVQRAPLGIAAFGLEGARVSPLLRFSAAWQATKCCWPCSSETVLAAPGISGRRSWARLSCHRQMGQVW